MRVCHVWDPSEWIPCEKIGIKHVYYVKLTSMTNSLVGDNQVAVVDVDEGVLEGSNMSWTHLNGFLVKKYA